MQQQAQHVTNSGEAAAPMDLISTEQIQKYLDENKSLIIAILENQNLGKMAESAQYQAILQKNLLYLASIADVQPQGTTVTSQSLQGNSNLQQVQALSIQQPLGVPVTKLSFQLNDARPQDQLFVQQQQQQPTSVQFSAAQQMQPTGVSNPFGGLTDFRSGGQGGWFEASSGAAQEQLGPAIGRELYQDDSNNR